MISFAFRHLLICTSLLLVEPRQAIACNFFGGWQDIEQGFQWSVYQAARMAWATGHIDSQTRDALSVTVLNSPKIRILIRNNEIYASTGFINHLVHLSVVRTFMEIDPLFRELSVYTRFRRQLSEDTQRAMSTDMYPYHFGLSRDECQEFWEKTGNDHSVSFNNNFSHMSFFWILHEISHYQNSDIPAAHYPLSWRQEYAADHFALDVLSSYFSEDVFVYYSGAILEAATIFSGSEHYVTDFIIRPEHPPVGCRKELIANYFLEFAEGIAPFAIGSPPELELVITDMVRDYLADSHERLNIECLPF